MGDSEFSLCSVLVTRQKNMFSLFLHQAAKNLPYFLTLLQTKTPEYHFLQ